MYLSIQDILIRFLDYIITLVAVINYEVYIIHGYVMYILQELKKNNAKMVVRCCDATYDIDPLRKGGVSVLVN